MDQANRVHSTPQITASKTNPPDQAPMTPDDEIGMAWWNALTKQERAKWSAIAGNTGRPKDAWEAFRRGSMDQSPPVDPTRRRFLAVAAGGAVAAAVATKAAASPLDDSDLLKLEEQIFEQYEGATAFRHARALLIEFVGGEPGKMLRDEFAGVQS